MVSLAQAQEGGNLEDIDPSQVLHLTPPETLECNEVQSWKETARSRVLSVVVLRRYLNSNKDQTAKEPWKWSVVSRI